MPKPVPPSVYTKEYYLSDCTGYQEFLRSKGEELDNRLTKILPYLDIGTKQNLLDIGCGRGELVFYAASKGLKAIGIDYSSAAINLALEAKQQKSDLIKANALFLHRDAKNLNLPANSFDWVVMTDVVEHLNNQELMVVYQNAYQVLAKGGKLIIHTEPNRLYNNITYPYYCYPLNRLLIKINQLFTHRHYPSLPPPSLLRTKSHQIMHINETSYFSLTSLLSRSGFKVKIVTTVTILKPILSFKDRLFNCLVCADPLSRIFPLNTLFANDFIVIAQK